MMRKPPEILNRLMRQFGPLVVITLIGAIAGGIYGAVKTPSYTAQAYVLIIGEPGDPMGAINYAQAYGRVTARGPIAQQAAATLGAAKGDLKNVTASTSPDAPVVEITATGSNAARTADVANAVAKALVTFGVERKLSTRVSASILTAASVPTTPSSPKPPLELAVGAAAGLLLGGLAILAGLGRPAGRIRRDTGEGGPAEAAASRYDIDDFRGRVYSTSITSYSETAAPAYDAPSITSYRATATPHYPAMARAANGSSVVASFRDAEEPDSDAAPHNGTPHNGAPHNGTGHNGASHNGAPHNGVDHSDAGHGDAGHGDAGHGDAGHGDAGHDDADHDGAGGVRAHSTAVGGDDGDRAGEHAIPALTRVIGRASVVRVSR